MLKLRLFTLLVIAASLLAVFGGLLQSVGMRDGGF